MAIVIKSPSVIKAAGTGNKKISEFFGRVATGEDEISIAHMKSPYGWSEPAQVPEFDEYTYVLKGTLQAKTKDKTWLIGSNQGIHVMKGEWVQYSTPYPGGADYIAICIPAFSPNIVHSEE